MKILRTVFWVLAALAFLVFATYNWQPVELSLWQNLVLETKVPMLVLLAFAAGFVPMWALHRSVIWGMNRRIRALENSLKNTAMAARADGGGASVVPITGADSPVEKPGKTPAEHHDPFDPADDSTAGADASDGGGGGDGGAGGGD